MVKAGTTEGRFRMAMPDILAEMKDICPDEKVLASMADAVTLRDQVDAGKLDFAFSGLTADLPQSLGKLMSGLCQAFRCAEASPGFTAWKFWMNCLMTKE